jgi:tripartite-type tricarboxylate transporter receptor subunit TctC
MKLPRRNFLHLAAGAAALPVVSRIAWAQAYPARPVHLIVPFAPAGPSDILARLIGQSLSERLGQQVVIDNRPGGGGNIGTEAVVRAPADGYTLLIVGAWNAVNATFYDKLNYNFIRDIAPVASIIRTPFVMAVNPTVPAKTVPEFIAYAKASPGKINYASAGTGTSSHLTGELFKMMAGVEMVHVPYRGSTPAETDLLGGQVQVMFDATPSSLPHIRAGKLRPLAVTTATRMEILPDVPAVGEFVPGYEASVWWGVGAPKATPAEIVEKLNKEINAGLADPNMKTRLADLGGTVLAGSPADFGKLIVDETEKWGKVVRFTGIKAAEAGRRAYSITFRYRNFGSPAATSLRGRRRDRCVLIIRNAARQAHREHRALARLARYGHVAAHHARELAGDGEAEPRLVAAKNPIRSFRGLGSSAVGVPQLSLRTDSTELTCRRYCHRSKERPRYP